MGITRNWSLYLAITFTVASVAAAQTDGTFTSWSTILLPSSASGAKCTAQQNTTDGTSAPSRKTQHDYPQGWINCAHIWLGGTYDPSSGAIVNLSYSYDLSHYTATLGGVRYSPLIVQNSTYYWIPLGDDIRSASWTPSHERTSPRRASRSSKDLRNEAHLIFPVVGGECSSAT